MNADNSHPIKLEEQVLEEVEAFTYLGSVVDKQGGTDADVRARIGKARAVFVQLKNIWSSKELSLKTKVQLFNTNLKSVLLYGSETWRTTVATIKRVITCLRKILQIRWRDTISNKDLWQRTNRIPADEEMQKRRWLGHTLRKPTSNTTRQALTWNPQGERERGRPQNTWRQDLEADTKKMGYTWGQLVRVAQDRDTWKTLVDGLCSRLG